MRITLVGPGRAGMSLALASHTSGHRIVTVVARNLESARSAAEEVGAKAAILSTQLEPSDLWIIATRDDAIGNVARALSDLLAEGTPPPKVAFHLSGMMSVTALDSLRTAGVPTASLHPLQTMPNPQVGSERLPGSWFAVTADDDSHPLLVEFVESLGGRPFRLQDSAKAVYHAAAAAAANFTLANMVVAQDLLDSIDVPIAVLGPLMDAIVSNAIAIGPRAALTGPIARGDVETVASQVRAVATNTPELLSLFVANVAFLARIAGRSEQFADLVDEYAV